MESLAVAADSVFSASAQDKDCPSTLAGLASPRTSSRDSQSMSAIFNASIIPSPSYTSAIKSPSTSSPTTPRLRLSTMSGRSSALQEDETLLTALKDLFVSIHNQSKKSGSVSSRDFIKKLREENELFRAPTHHDAHEFLNFLLNNIGDLLIKQQQQLEHLHEQKERLKVARSSGSPNSPNLTGERRSSVIPSSAHKSWIHELFEGVLANETRCLSCETISERYEPFLDLSVDIPYDHVSILACLKNFSAPEYLVGGNKFMCDECGCLQEAEKRLKIKRAPRVLALHLKRFKYVEKLGRHVKLNHRVNFPLQLRLPRSMLHQETQKTNTLYELFAVVVHLGVGPTHGHYVSIVRGQSCWWLFDDHHVRAVNETYLSRLFGWGSLLDADMAVPSVLVPQGQGTAHNDHDRDGGDVSDDKDFVEPIMPTEEGKAVYEAMVREVAGRGYGFVHGVPSGAGFDDVPQAGLSTAETDKDKGGKGKQTGVESVIPSGCGYILFYEATTIDT